jgi:alpha-tubulin suppressor-like RCC1 family protein
MNTLQKSIPIWILVLSFLVSGCGSLSKPTQFISITAGDSITCGLTSNGGVKCWGANWNGQLGNGSYYKKSKNTPVDVSGLASGVSAIVAGNGHVCALTSSGGVKCWGNNWNGELGNGMPTIKSPYGKNTPVDVVSLTSDVIALAVGGGHTCALISSGGVKCWGYNKWGQLGDGTTTDRTVPVGVNGLTSGVIAIDAGNNFTCALLLSGEVKCWGINDAGQLGNGTNTMSTIPVSVNGLTDRVIAISTGSSHTCALTSNGGVKCWGNNQGGQLGDGSILLTITNYGKTIPVDVNGLTSGVIGIAAGGSHTCALTFSGRVKCWGDNANGGLGNGTADTTTISYGETTPVDVIGLTNDISMIVAGVRHTCALTSGGEVKCWGWNLYGQLGNGTNISSALPVDIEH